MSIFKRLTSNSDKPTEEDARKIAAKRARRVSAEDITSSIRAELALEIDDIVDTDTILEIDDIADNPDIEADIKIPEPLENEHTSSTAPSMPSLTTQPEIDDLSLTTKQQDTQDIAKKTLEKEPEPETEITRDTIAREDESQNSNPALPVVTFSNEKTAQLEEDIELEEDIYNGPPKPRHASMNLSELRLDVVRISADIESGEELYRRAQQRVESLMTFVDQAEVTGSLLNKLEPENRRLKVRNRALQSEVISQTQQNENLEGDLEEQRRLASKARIKVETLKSQLNDAHEAIRERNLEIETLKSQHNDLRVQGERVKTSLDIETRENITMRERLKELSEKVETLNEEKIDTLKASENLKLDVEDQNNANEQMKVEVSELRMELGKTRMENEDMRDELVEIQEKVAQFKSHQELVLLRRDDKIVKLQSHVEELKEKLKLKEDVVQSAVTDVSEMRRNSTASVVEREKLEKIIDNQKLQLQAAEERILLTKKEAETLDRRYRNAAAELLEVQAQANASSKESAQKPDIYPTMKEQQLERQRQLDEDRDLELERQQAEHLDRITKVYERDPDDIRSRYLDDDPFISPKQSESG